MKWTIEYLRAANKDVYLVETGEGDLLVATKGAVTLDRALAQSLASSFTRREDILAFLRTTFNVGQLHYDPSRGSFYAGGPGVMGLSAYDAYPTLVGRSPYQAPPPTVAHMSADHRVWFKACGARRIAAGQYGAQSNMNNYMDAISGQTGLGGYLATRLPVGFAVGGETDSTSGLWRPVLYRLPRPAKLVADGDSTAPYVVANTNAAAHVTAMRMDADPGSGDYQPKARITLDLLHGLAPSSTWWSELDQFDITEDYTTMSPTNLPLGCMPTDWFIHGTLTMPAGAVYPKEKVALAADLAEMGRFWVERPASEESFYITSRALATSLRSSARHRTHAATLASADFAEIENAAQDLELHNFVIGCQTVPTGVLAKELQKWHPQGADVFPVDKVLNDSKNYQVKDFNRAWAGKREHTFLCSYREVHETVSVSATIVHVVQLWNPTTSLYEYHVALVQDGVSVDTLTGATGVLLALREPDREIYYLDPQSDARAEAILKGIGATEEDIDKVKTLANPLDDQLQPPFFSPVENPETDSVRFVTTKAFEDKQMLGIVIDTLVTERQLVKVMQRDE